jgi:glycosyltransferase involved in cell wall biosynthesis
MKSDSLFTAIGDPMLPEGGEWFDVAISVIVPTLNEEKNLPHVLCAIPDVHEVILVDGGSTDGTVLAANRLRPGIRVVRQRRRGKGNALACGFAEATGDIIVTIDADGSTNPSEIPRFVAALRAGADFAKGSRFVACGGSTDITPFRRVGNGLLNGLVNLLFRTKFSDLCYGYNAFWKHHLEVFELDGTGPSPGQVGDERRRWGDGFEIETLLNLRAARAGLRVVEVPSYEHPRIHGASNLNAVRDGLWVLRAIGREWRKKVAPVAATIPGPRVDEPVDVLT